MKLVPIAIFIFQSVRHAMQSTLYCESLDSGVNRVEWEQTIQFKIDRLLCHVMSCRL